MSDATLDWRDGRLHLSGAVTMTTVKPLVGQIDQMLANPAAAPEILLDCGRITASDSSVIALLVEINRKATQQGSVLRVQGLREDTASLIRLYGVEWILDEA